MPDLWDLFDLDGMDDLAALLLRVVVLYVVIVTAVRLTGKRGIGQTTALDFILALAIGDIIGEMAYGTESVLKGVTIIALWVLLHALTSYLGIRIPTIAHIVSGSKRLVVQDGQLLEREHVKELISREEVLMLLRNQSIEDLSKVRLAYLEPDGNLSVLMKEQERTGKPQT